MGTNGKIAAPVIRRSKSALAPIIAGTAMAVGFGAASLGQSAIAWADPAGTIQADPHSAQATTANHADQAPVPPPVEMKAVPAVKATPYWGEKKPG